MGAYYDTHSSPESVDEFLCDVNVKTSIPIFGELLSTLGSEPNGMREMDVFLLICKGRSGARVGRCPTVLHVPTN